MEKGGVATDLPTRHLRFSFIESSITARNCWPGILVVCAIRKNNNLVGYERERTFGYLFGYAVLSEVSRPSCPMLETTHTHIISYRHISLSAESELDRQCLPCWCWPVIRGSDGAPSPPGPSWPFCSSFITWCGVNRATSDSSTHCPDRISYLSWAIFWIWTSISMVRVCVNGGIRIQNQMDEIENFNSLIGDDPISFFRISQTCAFWLGQEIRAHLQGLGRIPSGGYSLITRTHGGTSMSKPIHSLMQIVFNLLMLCFPGDSRS